MHRALERYNLYKYLQYKFHIASILMLIKMKNSMQRLDFWYFESDCNRSETFHNRNVRRRSSKTNISQTRQRGDSLESNRLSSLLRLYVVSSLLWVLDSLDGLVRFSKWVSCEQ